MCSGKIPSYLKIDIPIVIKYEGRVPKTDKKKFNNKIKTRIITPTVIYQDRVSALCNDDGIIKTFLIGRMIYERDAREDEICFEKEEVFNPPTYIEMISDALRQSHERKLILNKDIGKRQLYLSRAGIKKWVIYNRAAYISVQAMDRALRNALSKGVASGKLIQYRQSFCLAPSVK